MFFAPSLIRKVGKIVKWCAIGFALGMFTCFAASCAPVQAYGPEAPVSEYRQNSRMTVYVENYSFQDARVYIVYDGHNPVRIGRVTATTKEQLKNVYVHTRMAVFLIRMDDGTEHAVGPLSIQPGMDVRLILNNSAAQDIAMPRYRT